MIDEYILEEIKRVYDLGACECWFEYREIYKGNKKKGEPYEIEFIIHKEKDSERINKQLILEEKAGRDKFEEILLEGLRLPVNVVNFQLERITAENCQAAISKALLIKAYIDEKPKDNPMAYVIKSLNDFFETYKPLKREEAKNPRQMWAKFITEICKNTPKTDAKNIYSKMFFDSFSEEERVLVIAIPDKDFAEKISEHKDLVLDLLGKHFGKNIQIKYKINKEA